MIIGACVGGVALLLVAGFIIFACLAERKAARKDELHQEPQELDSRATSAFNPAAFEEPHKPHQLSAPPSGESWMGLAGGGSLAHKGQQDTGYAYPVSTHPPQTQAFAVQQQPYDTRYGEQDQSAGLGWPQQPAQAPRGNVVPTIGAWS